jgi:hypothetical protein
MRSPRADDPNPILASRVASTGVLGPLAGILNERGDRKSALESEQRNV